MDWLYQGLLIELIVVIVNSFIKIIPKNHNNDNPDRIKFKFYFFLVSLILCSFLDILTIIISIKDKDYLWIIIPLLSIVILFFLVSNEFNNLWNKLYSKDFKNKNNK